MITRGLGIDFVPQKRINWSGGFLLAAGLSVMAYIAVFEIQAQKNISFWENRLHFINHKTQLTRPQSTTPASEAEVARMQDVIKRLNVPWQNLFDSLEKSIRSDITLASLQPDPKQGVVSISGKASSLNAVLEYAQSLQGTKYFSEVVLTEHEISETHEEIPVNFRLLLRWKPA